MRHRLRLQRLDKKGDPIGEPLDGVILDVAGTPNLTLDSGMSEAHFEHVDLSLDMTEPDAPRRLSEFMRDYAGIDLVPMYDPAGTFVGFSFPPMSEARL